MENGRFAELPPRSVAPSEARKKGGKHTDNASIGDIRDFPFSIIHLPSAPVAQFHSLALPHRDGQEGGPRKARKGTKKGPAISCRFVFFVDPLTSAGAHFTAENVIIRHNRIADTSWIGINLHTSLYPVSNVVVRDNVITRAGNHDPAFGIAVHYDPPPNHAAQSRRRHAVDTPFPGAISGITIEGKSSPTAPMVFRYRAWAVAMGFVAIASRTTTTPGKNPPSATTSMLSLSSRRNSATTPVSTAPNTSWLRGSSAPITTCGRCARAGGFLILISFVRTESKITIKTKSKKRSAARFTLRRPFLSGRKAPCPLRAIASKYSVSGGDRNDPKQHFSVCP